MFGGSSTTTSLGEVCCFKSGKTLPKKYEQENGDFIYAKVGDLNLPGNEISIVTSRTYVNEEIAKTSLIPSGSVCFPKRGGAIGTNKKRVIVEECCLDLNLMAVIPGEKITTEYLRYYFELKDLSEIANGSAVPQINNKDLEPLEIGIPSLRLQQEFAEFVAQVDKLKFACAMVQNILERLTSCISMLYTSA